MPVPTNNDAIAIAASNLVVALATIRAPDLRDMSPASAEKFVADAYEWAVETVSDRTLR